MDYNFSTIPSSKPTCVQMFCLVHQWKENNLCNYTFGVCLYALHCIVSTGLGLHVGTRKMCQVSEAPQLVLALEIMSRDLGVL